MNSTLPIGSPRAFPAVKLKGERRVHFERVSYGWEFIVRSLGVIVCTHDTISGVVEHCGDDPSCADELTDRLRALRLETLLRYSAVRSTKTRTDADEHDVLWCAARDAIAEVERYPLGTDDDVARCMANSVRSIIASDENTNPWIATARQCDQNAAYHRGLVTRIGQLLGDEARLADDGTMQDDVLCAKVPELIERRLGALNNVREDLDTSASAFGEHVTIAFESTAEDKITLLVNGEPWHRAVPTDEPTGGNESAALFGFMAWLTTRREIAGPFGGEHDCAPAVELIAAYCDSQGWGPPPDNWTSKLKPYPADSGSPRGVVVRTRRDVGSDERYRAEYEPHDRYPWRFLSYLDRNLIQAYTSLESMQRDRSAADWNEYTIEQLVLLKRERIAEMTKSLEEMAG